MAKVGKPVIIDTNVLISANGIKGQSAVVASECARRLKGIRDGGHVVIDNRREILREYTRHLNSRGCRGVGDVFFRWLIEAAYKNPERCTQVTITPDPDVSHNFLEFPRDHRLADFDNSDRKWPAVSNAHPEKPPILQATDSKWWGWREALAECGIRVDFVCPEEIAQKYIKKMGG